MKFVVALVCLAAFAAAKENVVTLTQKNFDSFVSKADFIVVEFYAPWCGHCKTLAPEYEKAAGELLKNNPPIILAKVDATEENELATKYGVRGYPTIKIFRNGEPTEYEGPREAAGIVSYVRKQAGPSSKPLETEADAAAFLDHAADVVVLGLFSDVSSAKYDIFVKTANALREKFVFAESSLPSLIAKYGVDDGVVLIQPPHLQSKSEQMTVTTTDLPSSVTLKAWINKNCLPVVGVLNEDTAERYDNAKKHTLTLWANIDFKLDPKGSNYIANRLRKVAKDFPSVSFTVGDVRSRMGSQVKTQHGISGPNDVNAVTIKSKEGRKYVFLGLTGQEKGFKVDGLETFLNDFIAGKVEPFLKSEAPPSKSTVDGLTTLTAKTFEDEVAGKPALLEFYAPWCGHCKSLAPIWEKLAKKLEDEDVVIAKMDATANDTPVGYEVQGFPTIFFKSASGSIEKYNGGRELADFLKFLGDKVSLSTKAKSEL